MDSRLCVFSHHRHDQWLDRLLGSLADSHLPKISESSIDNLTDISRLPQHRPLCRPRTRLCPIIATHRCALQYVTRSTHDAFRQSM